MSIDTKLKELIINTLSPEQFEGITPSTEEIYLVEDDEEYATVEELASKQDRLTTGNGIDITNNKISNNNQFVITEDMFELEYDDTKGVAPYSTSYGYTNVTIHDDAGVEWVEGASYFFVLDTKVATSTYRNVRVRIGESGDWKPLMTRSGAIAPGSTYFIKAMNIPFQYSTKYQTTGALNSVEYNTTYSINYSFDNGQHTCGVGAYAITRYSLCMQKPDMTWEKITDTSKNYTTATNKTVNKNGFLLNHIRYYSTTTNIANGALIANNIMYTKSASVDASYSFNCSTTPNWGIGKQVYIVGTVKDDGLFYLDENQWWSVELPTSNDGKLYIRIGLTYNATNATITFLDDRPIVYHDGTEIKEYIPHDDTKQDVITDLGDIRNNIATNTSNISYLDEKVRDIELFKFPNAVIIGEPTIQNGQVSNFSTVSYLQFPFILDLRNQAFQIDFSFTTATNVQTQQNILDSNFGLALAIQNGKGVMAISSNGTSWDIGSAIGTINIQSNTTYYARLIWNRLQYKTQLSTDGINYTDDMVIVDTRSPYPRTMFIGGCDILETGHTGHPFLGTINMNKATLSIMGNVIWQGMDDAGLATRADLSLSNLDELGEKRFTDKQDIITDLTAIRDGASKGATALQSVFVQTITTATDFNTLKTEGWYAINNSSCPNCPTANWGLLLVKGTGTWSQWWFPDSANNVYVRTGTNAWKKIPFDSALVHTTGNETIAGIKTFSNAGYGTGGVTINNTDGGASCIKFMSNGTKKGLIGIDASSKPILEDGGNNITNLVQSARNTAVGSSSQPVYINSSGVATAVTNKTWTGTLAQYNAITTKDANTLYYITDDDNVNMTVYLKTTYVSGASGYNIYSNGYCEQWGHAPDMTNKRITVTLLKKFRDTNYNVQAIETFGTTSITDYIHPVCIGAKKVDMFTIGSTNDLGPEWRACGYLASGEY